MVTAFEPPTMHETPAPDEPRVTDPVIAELIELERQPCPVDPKTAQLAGARWITEHWITAELEPYRGKSIVVLDCAVVAHGDDPNEIALEAVRRLSVHPYQLVTVYVPRRGEFFIDLDYTDTLAE